MSTRYARGLTRPNSPGPPVFACLHRSKSVTHLGLTENSTVYSYFMTLNDTTQAGPVQSLNICQIIMRQKFKLSETDTFLTQPCSHRIRTLGRVHYEKDRRRLQSSSCSQLRNELCQHSSSSFQSRCASGVGFRGRFRRTNPFSARHRSFARQSATQGRVKLRQLNLGADRPTAPLFAVQTGPSTHSRLR